MHPNAIHQCSSFTVLCDGMHSKNACLLSILTDSVGVQSLCRCRESDLTLKHAKILAWPALWSFPRNHLTIDNKNAIWLKNGNTIWAEEWHAKSARSLVLSLSVLLITAYFWVLNEFGAGFMVSEPPHQTGEEATEICYRKSRGKCDSIPKHPDLPLCALHTVKGSILNGPQPKSVFTTAAFLFIVAIGRVKPRPGKRSWIMPK